VIGGHIATGRGGARTGRGGCLIGKNRQSGPVRSAPTLIVTGVGCRRIFAIEQVAKSLGECLTSRRTNFLPFLASRLAHRQPEAA